MPEGISGVPKITEPGFRGWHIRPGFQVSLPEGISLNQGFQKPLNWGSGAGIRAGFVARGHITQSGVPKITELGFRGWHIRPGFQVSLPEGISLNQEFQELGFRGWHIRPGFQVSLPEGISGVPKITELGFRGWHIRPGFQVSLPEGISLNQGFQKPLNWGSGAGIRAGFVARGHITQSGVPKITELGFRGWHIRPGFQVSLPEGISLNQEFQELGFRGWHIRPGFQVSLPEGISLNQEFQKSPNWGSGAGILDQVSKFRCQRAYHSIGSSKNRRTGVQGLAY